MQNYRYLIYILPIVILFSSCSTSVQKDEIKPIEPPKLLINKKVEKPITVVEVNADEFFIDSIDIPKKSKIKRVKIMGASLVDVMSLLTEATNESIVYQLQSEHGGGTSGDAVGGTDGGTGSDTDSTSGSSLLTESYVYLSASNIYFGEMLKKSVGDKLSINYSDGTYYLGYSKTVTLKIPSIKELGTSLQTSLSTMGAQNIVHDPVTSSITFSARQKEYESIMKYLLILRNNLYVIEYDMEIYNVLLKDSFSLGIDWSKMPNAGGLILESAGALTSAGATSAPYTFGYLPKASSDTALFLKMLESFGKVESVKRPKLLGLAGTDVKLRDGTEVSYIQSIQNTIITNGGSQTSTESATALKGIEITLNSNIMDDTVVTNIDLRINDIVGWSEFSVNGNSYKQPEVSTKNIQNIMRVQPGVPIVISGLFRKSSDNAHQGLPGTSGTLLHNVAGSDAKSVRKSEMVIIVTPRLIKYELK